MNTSNYLTIMLINDSDHFDEKVEKALRRSLPIITTPHAKTHLAHKPDDEAFTSVYDLDAFQSMMVDIKSQYKNDVKMPAMKVTAMPGKHVPPGILNTLNELAHAVCIPFCFRVARSLTYSRSLPQMDGCLNLAIQPLLEVILASNLDTASTSRVTHSWSMNSKRFQSVTRVKTSI